MADNIFEKNYTNFIEPIYGPKRDEIEDNRITSHVLEPHEYSIHTDERFNMTDYEV